MVHYCKKHCHSEKKKKLRNPTWVKSFGATTEPGNQNDGIIPIVQLNDKTVRMIVHLSVGGKQIRLRLSNEVPYNPNSTNYKDQVLIIAKTRVGLVSSGANIVPGTNKLVTFNGKESVIILPGQVVLSDPICLNVPDESDISVSMYTDPESPGYATLHSGTFQTSYEGTVSGDLTTETNDTNFTALPNNSIFGLWYVGSSLYYLSGVDVLPNKHCQSKCSPISTIAFVGDSVTDGYNTVHNVNWRINNFLSQRLINNGLKHAVVSESLAGNQCTTNTNNGSTLGPAVVQRLARDVLSISGLEYVIIMVGQNDLNRGVSVDELKDGYRQIVSRLKQNPNIKVFGCTLLPATNNSLRDEANTWIRTSGVFDAVFDFYEVLVDPNNPNRLAPQYLIPPPGNVSFGIHPNSLGHQAMANSIDLGLFRGCCKRKCHYSTIDVVPVSVEQQLQAQVQKLDQETINDAYKKWCNR